jgi:23S rRNA pseudouridine1911/1915/1917 synthase
MEGTVRPPRIEILFEDDHLIAVVKPPGLPTANVPAGRASLFAWLRERFGPRGFVGIVSRLDAAVSGVVVAAKTPAAAASLAEQFRDRSVGKEYVAVVAGRFPAPLEEWREWTDWLVRGDEHQPSRVVAAPPAPPDQPGKRPPGDRSPAEPQEARTRARVVRRAGEVSLVELEPLTGRRHQLRAQLAARGCPIVGDRLYGSRLPFVPPGAIALHAARLSLVHPVTGAPLAFRAPWDHAWRTAFPGLFSGRPGH